jgi:hypothetical protein
MAKAIWEGAVKAEQEETIEVEGKPYFLPDASNLPHLAAMTGSAV